jgi:hypothetical protein
MGLEFKQLLKGFDWKISLGFDQVSWGWTSRTIRQFLPAIRGLV